MAMDSSERALVKVCVFGSGSFGTAMAAVIARNGFAVTMLTRRPEVAQSINEKRVNPQCLSDYTLPPNLRATTSAAEAIAGCSFIVHSIPVQSTQGFMEPLRGTIPADVPIISTSKGLHTETLETMAELVPRVLGRPQPMGFLSGPTFAKELMEGYPSAAVMAADTTEVAERCANLFNCSALRCYTTTDVVGVEIGGAIKNVYAIAAGAVEGTGLGVNSVSFMVTRACAEMNELAVARGAKAHTMAGLAGIGDLMLTCLGGASRNKAVGVRIGKGESLSDILGSRKASMAGVAEGVATTPAALRLAKELKVRAPIIAAVAAVLEGKTDFKQACLMLMTERPAGEDFAAVASRMERSRRPSFQVPKPQVTVLGLPLSLAVAIVAAEAALLGGLALRFWRQRR